MSVVKKISEYRVSSVLNGDRKMYGKKFLFDGNDETCWNSDKGSPQKIEFSFKEPQQITKLNIQFQGGFAAKSFELECLNCDTDTNTTTTASSEDKIVFHPVDSNQMQEFPLTKPVSSKNFRIILGSSYDFYGRIIIYHLDIIG